MKSKKYIKPHIKSKVLVINNGLMLSGNIDGEREIENGGVGRFRRCCQTL